MVLKEPVTVKLPAYRWFELLGYLSGVGVGDELEAYSWINNQVRRATGMEDDDT